MFPPPTGSGGAFSVQYKVTDTGGKEAFMKALDYTWAHNQQDVPAALLAMTSAYTFERDLLLKCEGHNLTRVTTPLDHGDVKVPGFP